MQILPIRRLTLPHVAGNMPATYGKVRPLQHQLLSHSWQRLLLTSLNLTITTSHGSYRLKRTPAKANPLCRAAGPWHNLEHMHRAYSILKEQAFRLYHIRYQCLFSRQSASCSYVSREGKQSVGTGGQEYLGTFCQPEPMLTPEWHKCLYYCGSPLCTVPDLRPMIVIYTDINIINCCYYCCVV